MLEMNLSEYMNAIAKRGDRYGGNGGLLSLLEWCDKPNTAEVTEDEARMFWENPEMPYGNFASVSSRAE